MNAQQIFLNHASIHYADSRADWSGPATPTIDHVGITLHFDGVNAAVFPYRCWRLITQLGRSTLFSAKDLELWIALDPADAHGVEKLELSFAPGVDVETEMEEIVDLVVQATFSDPACSKQRRAAVRAAQFGVLCGGQRDRKRFQFSLRLDDGPLPVGLELGPYTRGVHTEVYLENVRRAPIFDPKVHLIYRDGSEWIGDGNPLFTQFPGLVLSLPDGELGLAWSSVGVAVLMAQTTKIPKMLVNEQLLLFLHPEGTHEIKKVGLDFDDWIEGRELANLIAKCAASQLLSDPGTPAARRARVERTLIGDLKQNIDQDGSITIDYEL